MKDLGKILPSAISRTRKASVREPSGKASVREPSGKAQYQVDGRDHVDVINQVFAEFELAYHNQFHKAFAQEGSLALAKKYWLGCLQEFPPEVILRAVRKVVKSQEYLPTIAAVTAACENAHELFGLPSAQAAYVEACCQPEPKVEQQWSHPAVYLAGQATGWYELGNRTQSEIFEVFSYNYSELCRRVVHGEDLQVPVQKALPQEVRAPLSAEENRQRLKKLREQFDL